MGIFRQGWRSNSSARRVMPAVAASPRKFVPGGVQAVLFFLFLAFSPLLASPAQAQTFGCTPAMANDIVCENSKPGNPDSQWDVSSGDAGDPSIQGFATDISVAQGGTISFKVKTNASAYTLSIYRMGYYAGNGARLIATINPSVSLPQSQPACKTDSTTKLYDCGNWAVSASWTVPSNATSGIYFVHLVRTDTGGDSHIVFVVRNDASHSNILFQTSDEAWQAYNDWGGSAGVLGGNTLYGGPGVGNWDYTNRAYKVSYNRPYDTRSFEAATWVFGNEYPMVRWLEANGYDVTYFTHVDGVRNSSLITNHKIYMSTGHDEYWTGTLRGNIEAARDAGVNLAFFSGNEVFWKTRWENSIDGSNTAYRTLVCYKETYPEAQIDPEDPPTWTGTWRDPTFSPPSDGGRPENNFTGTLFMVNGPGSDDTGISMKVPQADGQMRFWRNTSEAKLASGATATLPAGTLGYEWDVDPDNGFRPAGTFDLSTATYNLTSDLLLDYGVTYGAGPATHHMTLHRAASGALVFGAGTVQYSWGLDSNHDNDQGFTTPAASKDMQQATINLFADMGVQPATIQGTLLLATQSTDTTPPTSVITSPTAGANLTLNVSTTVKGTATDSGGGVVGGVEVSVNGGQTWHPASGRASWTYSFTPTVAGALTILSRAVDDSGNIETPGPGVSVTAGTITTYTISGTISPTAAGNGATVKLTGTSTATVTANSSGAYTFSGLVAGSYTVTPTQTGYVFNPVSTAVTVTNANVSNVNFTGTQSTGTTYSISGSVTPVANGTGVTINLTGTATASTVTDASGNFTFSNLNNGPYTLTPSKVNFAFAPPQNSVTVSGANVTGVTFAATATSQTLFTTQTPASVNQSDGTSVNYELGTLFQSNAAGQITAIRFWKDSKETGTHTGHLWSSTGTVLETVTFTNETASGWQQQALTTPYTIAANTTYVVSVNTGATYYVTTTSGLASQIVNGNLSSVVGNNGVYGSPATFPTNSWETSNYFRDVVFAPASTVTIAATGGTPQSAAISTAFPSQLQVTVKDTNNNPVSGATVTFAAPGSGPSGTFAGGLTTATTNASGVASSAVFTANSTAGSYTVTASATGVNTPANFSLTNNAGAPASVTATAGSSQSATVNTAFATALQATVKDTGNNPVSGVTVTFVAPSTGASGTFAGGVNTATTNSSGVATAPAFTANGTTGSYSVTASVAGVSTPASFNLTNTAVPPASITASAGTPQTATIGAAFATPLQATVKDASSNPVSGVNVTFTAPGTGASGTFGGSATVTTDSNGLAIAPTFTANNTAGSYTVTASVAGVSTPASFSLTNNAGAAASVAATAGNSQNATINTAFATALQATVKDTGNNPVSGVTVTFAAPGTGASGTFAGGVNTATTNSSGVAIAPAFTANSTTGSYTVTASVAGVSTPASFNLTNVLAPPASITTSGGTPQTATIGTAFATLLQATVKDASSNPVSGVNVTFVAPGTGASGTFGGSAIVATNSSGVAMAPTFTANNTAGAYTVTASVAGVSTPASFSLTNSPGPAASVSATAGTPQSAAISTAFAAALQATVKDASNNPLSGVSVTFAAPGTGASGTFGGSATVTTNGSGVAMAPTFTANSTTGSYTVTASVAGIATPASFSLTNTAQASISIDVNKSTDRGTAAKTIASPSFTTTSANELILAFVAADDPGTGTNVSVSSIATTGLTWALVERTNTQRGTSEIWRAFATTTLSGVTATATLSKSVAASITVMSFKGVSTSGTNGSGAIGAVGTANANPGAPAAALVTTMANSLVIGVGNDWDNAISRTPGPNQTVVHQYLSTTGDTYWVQEVTTLSPAGTLVTVNDTAPTTDRYNLSICEILP